MLRCWRAGRTRHCGDAMMILRMKDKDGSLSLSPSLSLTHTNQHTRTRRANLHPPSHQHETLHHLSGFFLRFTSACMSAREHSVVCLLCLLMMFWGMHSTHQTDGSLKSKGSMRNKVSHLGRSTDLPKTKTRSAGRG